MDDESNYIKSIPVSIADIPKSGEALEKYLGDVIKEAFELAGLLRSPPIKPWSFHFKKANKYGEVEVSSRNHHIDQGVEYWFARRSVHKLEGGNTGFEWEDFVEYLLKNHSENEIEYGPTVSQVDKINIDFDTAGISILGWDVVGVAPYAIHHHLPWPLNPRVFPILLIQASAVERKDFMIISLPINISTDTRGKNTATDETVNVIGPKTTIGQYVAVERVLFQDAEAEGEKPRAIWCMATASDASGNLPMALQRRVIGTSIFKDVEAFLDFAGKKKAA
ncbi:hypothetical protein ABW19_dt0204989 [Dactylella cylindrospora]|nr:hypothetical protein ABW19_dt0204989 [Dactylella cylindrospora]